MPTHQVIGLALLAGAVSEVVALFVLRAGAKDERQKSFLTIAITSSALMFAVLGALFLTGVVGASS